MRNRTVILAGAVLAISGFGLSGSLVSHTFAQSTPGQQTPSQRSSDTAGQSDRNSNRSDRLGSDRASNNSSSDSQGDVKGVQQLFARATEDAVKPDGVRQLRALFASDRMGGANSAGGSDGRLNRDSSSSSGAGSSGATDRFGNSSSGASGAAAGQSDRSDRTRSNGSANDSSGIGSSGTSANSNRNSTDRNQGGADSQALNQTIQQFQQAWKQKYSGDFRIQDPALVFADIKADDIMSGQAQSAGSRERGTQSGNSDSSRSGASSGSSNAGSSSGANRNDAGTSGNSASSSGTGASAHSQAHSSDASSTGMNQQAITIKVPQVEKAEAVTLRVVRQGTNEYKFASAGREVDQQRLASALEKHLKEVVDSKDQWPSDQQKAQRLVTQHVLMAISEVGMGHGAAGENAQPAGNRIPGETGTNSDRNSSGTGQSGTSGRTGSTGAGSNGSR